MISHLQPPGLLDARPFGFSHVSMSSRSTIVHIAGQTAVDDEGRPLGGDDLGHQTRCTLENLGKALTAAGATRADLLALRVYVVGLKLPMFPIMAPHVAAFIGAHDPPPATWIGVQSLLIPTALVEIEAVAAVG